MFAYISKRLLLMIPTLIGVMLITFLVTQFIRVFAGASKPLPSDE